MEIFTLEHLYDFLRQKHGDDFAELAQKLVGENVSRATQRLEDNIDIYMEGFVDSLEVIEAYEEKYPKIDYDDSTIKKAKRLDRAIYRNMYNNYYANVGD